jgi:hypothetical protein
MDFYPGMEVLLEAAARKQAELRAELEASKAAAAEAAAAAAAAAVAAGEPPPPPPPVQEEEGAVPPPLGLFQDKHGCTALHLAARQGHTGAAGLLLDDARQQRGSEAAAALARSRNKAGQSALHLAALAGSAAVAALLAAAAPDAAAAKTKLGLAPAALADKRRHAALAVALRGDRPAQALQQLTEAEAGSRKAAPPPAQRTLLVAPPECLFHFTCPAPITRETSDSAPPENVERLSVLTKPGASATLSKSLHAACCLLCTLPAGNAAPLPAPARQARHAEAAGAALPPGPPPLFPCCSFPEHNVTHTHTVTHVPRPCAPQTGAS